MTDRAKFEQMLESLINGDQKQAEEIFHDLVVAKSREIYENLLDDDIQVDEEKDEDEEEVEENFDMDMQEVGGDPADDMMGDMGADDEEGDFGDEGDDEMSGGDDEPATKDDVMDIKDALDDLKAEFEAMLSGKSIGDVDGDGDHDMDDHDAEGDDDMGDMDDEEEKKESYQFEEDEDEEGLVREYVEKVAPAKMGDNGANSKSIVAGKNNMGGTTANIVKGGTEAGVEANKGHLKGSSLFKGTPKDLNSGNVNVPGSKNATKMSPTKGHGAEKKGAGEQAANTRSIVGK
jgi:hypothetical protein